MPRSFPHWVASRHSHPVHQFEFGCSSKVSVIGLILEACGFGRSGSLVCDRQPACLALARRVVSSSFFSCKGASRVCDSMACWFLSASIHISCCEDRQASYLMPTKLVQLALFVRLRVGSSLAIVFADSLGESLACVPSWEEDGRTAAFRTSRVAWIVPEIAVLLACGPSKWQCSR